MEDIGFSSTCVLKKPRDIDLLTEDELEKFYHALNSSKIKPAILKITPPYSKEFIPRSTDPSLPLPISQLYDPETLELGYLCLLKKCEEVARGLRVWMCVCVCVCVRACVCGVICVCIPTQKLLVAYCIAGKFGSSYGIGTFDKGAGQKQAVEHS